MACHARSNLPKTLDPVGRAGDRLEQWCMLYPLHILRLIYMRAIVRDAWLVMHDQLAL